LIYGIAYHSPLDVITLLPLNTKVSTDPTEISDVVITDKVVKNFEAKIQLVFASYRVLFKHNLPIIDQGPWGKVLTLTSIQFEKILATGKEVEDGKQSGIPEWVRLSKL
jgi:hypothetical protein